MWKNLLKLKTDKRKNNSENLRTVCNGGCPVFIRNIFIDRYIAYDIIVHI